MTKKFFSLIVVPHHKGKSKTFTLSEKKVKVFGWVIAFLFIAFFALLFDYFSMSGTRQKYKDLYDENTVQKGTITRLKASLNKLKTSVDNIENYASKINTMAGLKSPEVLREIGVGGGGRSSDQEMNFSSYSQDLNLTQLENVTQKAEGLERNLNTMVRFFENKSLEFATTPSIWPTTGWTSSGFGERTDPFTGKRAFHYGIDIVSGYGNPIVATADGIVADVKSENIGGKTIIINHQNGYTTVYCHLSKFNVKPGQKVKRHDVIGFIGSTGKSMGPHVHYEVRLNGRAINPLRFILEE
jgi:murein DD-endopeptidase MepM/ murein hydrolase activator NlpD